MAANRPNIAALVYTICVALALSSVHVEAAPARALLATAAVPTVVPPNCNPTGAVIICGPGTARPRCPTTACTNSFSSAASGPNGCSTSYSQISAISFSSSYWSPLVSAFRTNVQSLCTGASNLQFNGQPAYLAYTQAISNLVAQTTAATLIQYAQYVCLCNGATSGTATSQVSANVQAVADVIAQSYSQAIASVEGDVGNGCAPYEDFLTFSNASATAVAQSIELATDQFFSSINLNPSSCMGGTTLQNQFSTKVATTVSCTIAEAYGLVYTDPAYPSTAAACSRSASFTGLGANGGTAQCDVTPVCPCSSSTNLVQNPGFESGDFTGWTQGGNLGATFVSGNDPHTGTFSAQLGPVGSDGTLSQTFFGLNPASNVYYQLSFWLAHSGGSTNDFSLTLLDSNNNPISVVQAYGPYPGSAPPLPITNGPDFEYNEYVFTFTPLSASATITFQFNFREDPAYYYLDDISFRCSQFA